MYLRPSRGKTHTGGGSNMSKHFDKNGEAWDKHGMNMNKNDGINDWMYWIIVHFHCLALLKE